MTNICIRSASCAAIVFGLVISSSYADWPQFLGPSRNGVAKEAKELPRSWPAGGPKVVWEAKCGKGFGGAAIYGDSVLVLDRQASQRDVLRRIGFADGKDVWSLPYDAPGKLMFPGSRSTPATDGELVFAIGPHGHLHAAKFSDGSIAWKANLLEDWEIGLPKWGIAGSPLLLADIVVVNAYGKKAAVVAYEKATGEVAWTTSNPQADLPTYSSPVTMTLDGKQMIVSCGSRLFEGGRIHPYKKTPLKASKSFTTGIDPATGEVLWSYNGYECQIHAPSPVVLDDGRIFLIGGYSAGCAMIKVERAGETYAVKELWKNDRVGSKVAQAFVHNGRIYANGGQSFDWYVKRKNGFFCMGLDGELLWNTLKDPWFEFGNVLMVDGVLLVMHGQKGELVMIAPNPNDYKELARARVLSGKQLWAPMAYSNGKLVLRDHSKIVCLDLMAK